MITAHPQAKVQAALPSSQIIPQNSTRIIMNTNPGLQLTPENFPSLQKSIRKWEKNDKSSFKKTDVTTEINNIEDNPSSDSEDISICQSDPKSFSSKIFKSNHASLFTQLDSFIADQNENPLYQSQESLNVIKNSTASKRSPSFLKALFLNVQLKKVNTISSSGNPPQRKKKSFLQKSFHSHHIPGRKRGLS